MHTIGSSAPGLCRWQSSSGPVVTIRPTRAEDANITQDFVRELSPESRYFRFMGTLRELTPQMLTRFVSVDNQREVALVAVTAQGGRMRQLGECRYAACADSDCCEFAVAVLDAWQRRGLGRRLMSELIAIARISGFEAITGEVMSNNASMLALASKLGFKVSASREDRSITHVSLALPPPARIGNRCLRARPKRRTASG